MSTSQPFPKLTVALSVYDGVNIAHLKESLESVLTQKGVEFEFFIVLDGIKRLDLRDLIHSAAHRDKRIKLINFTENRKLAAAMNEIIHNMNSDFFVRMDADDISMPNRLRKLYEFMEENPSIDIAGSASYEFDGEDPKEGMLRVYPNTHEDIVQQFNYNNPFCHPSIICRKSFFKIGLYPLCTINEDTLLFLNGLVGKARYANINEPLYAHRFDKDVGRRRQKTSRSITIWLDRMRIISLCNGGTKARAYATVLMLVQILGGPIYPIVRRHILKRQKYKSEDFNLSAKHHITKYFRV